MTQTAPARESERGRTLRRMLLPAVRSSAQLLTALATFTAALTGLLALLLD